MVRVYLGVGSNLGDRSENLKRAEALVRKLSQTHFLRSSSVSETDPVGGPPQGKYLNAVWEIETELSPEALKEGLREIESRFGRKRAVRNAPREIDLDILFYGEAMLDTKTLKIPHPRLHERSFVLNPLAELSPGFHHPKLKKTVQELLEALKESSSMR